MEDQEQVLPWPFSPHCMSVGAGMIAAKLFSVYRVLL